MFCCSYCGTIFLNYHNDVECKDVLQEAIFNATIKQNLDIHILKLILNYINNLSK